MRPQAYPTPSPRAPGSAVLWRQRARIAEARSIEPARDAAVGRYWALHKPTAVPQRNSRTPGAVAWHRASGAQPGYMNRRYRREAQRHLR